MSYKFSGDNSDNENVTLDRQIVPMNDIFWYLRPILQSDERIDEDVSHRIRARCVKWR
jgi:hypothetical protein